MSSKAVIYARVSSTGERQSTERQVADLKKYAAASDIEVVRVYEEKTSGAKMLLTVLGLGAEIERKNIVSRLNSGRRLAIEKGVQLGRPVGSGMTEEELLRKYPLVVKSLKKGLSVRDSAAVCRVSTYTVQKVKKAMK